MISFTKKILIASIILVSSSASAIVDDVQPEYYSDYFTRYTHTKSILEFSNGLRGTAEIMLYYKQHDPNTNKYVQKIKEFSIKHMRSKTITFEGERIAFLGFNISTTDSQSRPKFLIQKNLCAYKNNYYDFSTTHPTSKKTIFIDQKGELMFSESQLPSQGYQFIPFGNNATYECWNADVFS